MTAASVSGTLSLQELRNAAELLERECVAAGHTDPAALDARRPGSSPAYAAHGPSDWLAYYGWLHAQLAIGESGAAARAERPLAQVLHEALNDEPVAVALRSGESVYVHPKSLDTLLWLEGLDADLVQCTAELREVATAIGRGEPSVAQAAFVGALLQGLALRLFVWTLTHEGPGRPFTTEQRDPEPPAWTAALHAEDLEGIMRAHLRVNRDDLEFLAAAFPADQSPGSTRLPLSGFLGAMAHEWGLSAKVTMRQFTLRGLYAQAITAAQSQREALAAAPRARGGA